MRENGATSGSGVLATFDYDDLGRPVSLTRGNGALTTYAYDPVSRLQTLTDKPSSATYDQTITLTYNPASQIVTRTGSNDAYAWTGHGNGSTAYAQNGLNQQATIGGASASWDSKGNLTSEPQSGKTYGYSSENMLTSASGGVALAYDPQLRLYQVAGAGTTRFAYDALDSIAEYDGSNVLQRRFVFGPGMDEPIVQYDGSGTSNRSFMGTDERGSVISLTDSSGAVLTINRYDEYGKPQSTNAGRFQYTGQRWLSEAGLYDYKARAYLPHLGIFGQTDPIGMQGGINLYAYVLADPINLNDPLGLECPFGGSGSSEGGVITCPRLHFSGLLSAALGGTSASNGLTPGGNEGGNGPGSGCILRGDCQPGKWPQPVPKTRPCNPTVEQLKNSGTVHYLLSENTITYGFLYTHVEGHFTTTGGYSGWFETTAQGLFVGKGTGVGGGSGTSESLWTFSGTNYNIVGALGPVSISDNFSTSGSHVGDTNALATFGMGIGGTKSVTTLKNVQCPTQ